MFDLIEYDAQNTSKSSTLALSTSNIQPIHPLSTMPADASKGRKQPESGKRTVTINIHGKVSLIFIISMF